MTVLPVLKDATIWAGSQPMKSTDVGIPCSKSEGGKKKSLETTEHLKILNGLSIKITLYSYLICSFQNNTTASGLSY